MQLVRTTVRLEKQLKKAVQKIVLEEDTTFQRILNHALKDYIEKKARKGIRKLKFPSINLGVPLDNLSRDDIYGEPEIPC
ncbi:hypothetical protein BH09PAT2_BH09PAT2_10180 [soil metagenome]